MSDPYFVKRTGKALEPGWVVNEKELNAICPTCKSRVPGGVDGLVKHLQKIHNVKPPKVEFVPNE